jgi:hypothetical protein
MSNSHFSINEPYRLHVRQLRSLHQFFVEGKEDSPEADALRDEMDVTWDQLSAEQQQSIGGLSADLNWIIDGPVPSKQPREEVFREHLPALLSAREAENWHDVLKHLRPLSPFLPAAELAFLRGRAWTHLGDDETALLFFQHAHQFDPEDKTFAWVARDCSLGNGSNPASTPAEEVRR